MRRSRRAGKLRQTISYLEMTAPPSGLENGPPDPRLGQPMRLGAAEYRALYRAVGERWLWWERWCSQRADLAAILDDPRVEVRLFTVDGETAGYSEINRRGSDGGDGGAIEIVFLGLVPKYLGRGLGRGLLDGKPACRVDEPGGILLTAAPGLSAHLRSRPPGRARLLPRSPAFGSFAARRC